MNAVLVDSNVILDLFLDDPIWAEWSENTLKDVSKSSELCINPIIYTEISIGFYQIETLETAIQKAGFKLLDIPKESLFLAGKAFLQYRRNKGKKNNPLPDFYIGAQAAVLDLPLITRDRNRFRTYFPSVKLIYPDT